MTTHDLKINQKYYEDVLAGRKSFEVRRNDRNFREKDIVLMQEYDCGVCKYTGRAVICSITYILSDVAGLSKDYVVFSFQPLFFLDNTQKVADDELARILEEVFG